jgi:Zn-finger nucleic acid-binding protein/ribosomal protein L40E
MMKQCPRCIRPLEETSWMEVSLKGCPLCGGTWFPGGHLDLLVQNAPQTLADLEAQWSGSQPTSQAPGGTLWCPECDFAELQPLALFPEAESQPAGCPQCQGVWLEEGMLTVLQHQLEAGWQMPAGGLGTLIQAQTAAAEAPEPVPASATESDEPAPQASAETELPPEEPWPAPEALASPETAPEAEEPMAEAATAPLEPPPEEPGPAPEAPPPAETVAEIPPDSQPVEELPEPPPLEAAPPPETPEAATPPVDFEEAPAPAATEPETPAAPPPEAELPEPPPLEAAPPPETPEAVAPPVDFEEAPAPAATEPETPAAPPPEAEAPSPWVCAQCGAELPPEAKFCARCGKPVQEKGKGLRFPSWREVCSAVCPLWKEALQPFRPGDGRKAWQGAALGAGAGILLGLLTLLIPGWVGKLVGLVVLFAGSAAAAAFVLYPEPMARRSPQGTHSLLLAAVTGLLVGLPLGLLFAPFMRPVLRGALTGLLLVVVMEQGPSAYCSHLADLGRLVGNTVVRFFPKRKA